MKSESKSSNDSLLRGMSSELTLQREIITGQVDPQDKEAMVIKSKYESYLMSIIERCISKLSNNETGCEDVKRLLRELLSKISAQGTAISGLGNDFKTLSAKVSAASVANTSAAKNADLLVNLMKEGNVLSIVPSASTNEENQVADPPPRKRWRDSVWEYIKNAFVGKIWMNYHFWIVFVIALAIACGIYKIIDNKNRYLEQTARLEWLDVELREYGVYRATRFEVNQLIDEVGTDSVRVLIREKKMIGK